MLCCGAHSCVLMTTNSSVGMPLRDPKTKQQLLQGKTQGIPNAGETQGIPSVAMEALGDRVLQDLQYPVAKC